MDGKMTFNNTFTLEHYRNGVLIGTHNCKNAVVTVGVNLMLDTMFRGTAQGTWYVGLIDNASFTTLANTHTMSSHAGWTELTAYDQATRPTWDLSVAASGRAISSQSTPGDDALFTFNATKTVKGAFLVNNNTRGGTTGTLFAEASLDSTIAVVSADQIKMYYTISVS
jgi:hypothetical protein